MPKLELIVGMKTGIPEIDAVLANLDLLKTFTKILFPLLRQRGVLTSFYDMSTIADFDYALEFGVGGIIVDTPSALKTYLVQKGLYL